MNSFLFVVVGVIWFFLTLQQPVLGDIPDSLVQKMAMVAKGESGVDITDPVCVMRNRIIAGWNPHKVLNHFYAPPRAVSDDEIEKARIVLMFGVGCNPSAYFQWSLDDVRRVRPNESSFLYEKNGNVYYDVNALKGR